jgi:predicted secreted protein
MRSIRDPGNGQPIAVAIGETIDVVLSEHATSGYRWRLISHDEQLVHLESEAYESASGAVPGAPGSHILRLTALRPGRTMIRMASARAGQPAAAGRTLALPLLIAPG